jgi:hypothetical protein
LPPLNREVYAAHPYTILFFVQDMGSLLLHHLESSWVEPVVNRKFVKKKKSQAGEGGGAAGANQSGFFSYQVF